jgi:hypothetical protein
MMAPDLHFELAPAPADLAPLWRDLESRADPPFFLSWHWIGTWVATIADAPMLLTGRAAGTVVVLGLLLPSKQRTLRLWPTHGLRLHTTGDEAEDVITIEYNGFLVARSWEGRAETAAIAFPNGESASATDDATSCTCAACRTGRRLFFRLACSPRSPPASPPGGSISTPSGSQDGPISTI